MRSSSGGTAATSDDGGRAGWLFQPGDPGSLAETLERAAGDPAEARRKGGHARDAAGRLDWDIVGEKTAQLLRGATG